MNYQSQKALSQSGSLGLPRKRSRLYLRGVTVGHDGQDVLQIDEVTVSEGEIVALIGPSGCGKTTLVETIAGFCEPRVGEIRINGQLMSADQRRRAASMIFQSSPILPWLTVGQQIELCAKIRGQQVEVINLLTRFAAKHLVGKRGNALSGGERARVCVALAAASSPAIVLADEPFSGLDLAIKAIVARSLFTFATELGAGVLLVTHDVVEAAKYASRVIILSKGEPVSHVISEIATDEKGIVDRIYDLMIKTDESAYASKSRE